MIKKRYLILIASLFTFLVVLPALLELYIKEKHIIELLVILAITFIFTSTVLLIINFVMNKIFIWYDKFSANKYNLYEWTGNPQPPIKFYEEFSILKDFKPEKFKENCEVIKEKIKADFTDLSELKSYRTYLELKTKSPRSNSILNSSQTVIIAVLTASLITFLNFTDTSSLKIITSYIFLLLFGVGLFKVIDFLSKAIDRNNLLLVLVNECIEENPKTLDE